MSTISRRSLISTYHSDLFAGTGVSPSIPYRTIPWLAAWETLNTATPLARAPVRAR